MASTLPKILRTDFPLFHQCILHSSAVSRAAPHSRRASSSWIPPTTRSSSPTRKDPLFRFYSLSKQNAKAPRVLITGGMGQLGRSLANIIKYMYGSESVLLTDICKRPADFKDSTSYCYLNILDRKAMEEAVVNHNIDTVIHFSALLSAVGEQNVELALQVNCQGVQNILNLAKDYKLKVFIPSTIGVFGESTPRSQTPDLTIQRPKTIYGVTKVFAELLGEYYTERFAWWWHNRLCNPNVYDAILHGKHTCYLSPKTTLPMMYDTDCMASVINFILTPAESLSLRTYNVTGFSFNPQQLADGIRRFFPDFKVDYKICSVRQRIADSWPQSLDDSTARRDWNWKPEFDIDATVEIMLERVSEKLKPQESTETTTAIFATM
uniref:NAD-dependent epimerase/dehydratase domain-containing protein n=1 Tax=Ditylenchus dipsaci TaxID=166011 RepID=A0A915D772_9BILA